MDEEVVDPWSEASIRATLGKMGLPAPMAPIDLTGNYWEIIDRVFAQIRTEHALTDEEITRMVMKKREQALGPN